MIWCSQCTEKLFKKIRQKNALSNQLKTVSELLVVPVLLHQKSALDKQIGNKEWAEKYSFPFIPPVTRWTPTVQINSRCTLLLTLYINYLSHDSNHALLDKAQFQPNHLVPMLMVFLYYYLQYDMALFVFASNLTYNLCLDGKMSWAAVKLAKLVQGACFLVTWIHISWSYKVEQAHLSLHDREY